MCDQRERLKKLYALATQGVGGERENASALLDRLMKKYGVTLEELGEEPERYYDIKFKGRDEERLLMQVAYKVTGKKDNLWYLQNVTTGRKLRAEIRLRCTAAQRVEIDFLFDFYKRKWAEEREALFRAFIQHHRIFAENGETTEITKEEAAKLALLSQGLSDERPVRQIGAARAERG